MRQGRTRLYIGERPNVNPRWLIMNAPRPLYGTVENLGRGPEGLFTVAIDLSADNAAWMVRENRNLDACTVVYVTPEFLYSLGLSELIAHATGSGIEIVTSAVGRETYRNVIEDRGIDILNYALSGELI